MNIDFQKDHLICFPYTYFYIHRRLRPTYFSHKNIAEVHFGICASQALYEAVFYLNITSLNMLFPFLFKMATCPPDIEPGNRINGWYYEKCLGKGAFGTVKLWVHQVSP